MEARLYGRRERPPPPCEHDRPTFGLKSKSEDVAPDGAWDFIVFLLQIYRAYGAQSLTLTVLRHVCKPRHGAKYL